MSQTRQEKLKYAMARAEELETALASNASIVSVATDGVSVTYSRKQALLELEHWRKQVVRYSRSNSRFRRLKLGGGHD